MLLDLGRLIFGQFPPRIRHALPTLFPQPLPDRAVADPQLFSQLTGSNKVVHASSVSTVEHHNQNPTARDMGKDQRNQSFTELAAVCRGARVESGSSHRRSNLGGGSSKDAVSAPLVETGSRRYVHGGGALPG